MRATPTNTSPRFATPRFPLHALPSPQVPDPALATPHIPDPTSPLATSRIPLRVSPIPDPPPACGSALGLNPDNFSEFWVAAAAAGDMGVGLAGDIAISSGEQPSSRWLLVSDSASLKAAAAATWPGKVRVTSLAPTHIMCSSHADLFGRQNRSRHGGGSAHGAQGGEQSTRAEMVQTVAEMLLLAESDALVLGRSRFAYVALLLSRTIRQSFHLTLDRSRMCQSRWRKKRARLRSDASWTMRCVGTGGLYSIRALQDERGAFRSDAHGGPRFLMRF